MQISFFTGAIPMKEQNIGAQLAAMRKPKNKSCPVCGTEFITVGRRIYCSSACRCKAYYRRQKKLVTIGRNALKIEENQRMLEEIRLLREDQT
jgi:predicted nucleic acid-binding Zn ribbon protein